VEYDQACLQAHNSLPDDFLYRKAHLQAQAIFDQDLAALPAGASAVGYLRSGTLPLIGGRPVETGTDQLCGLDVLDILLICGIFSQAL
jgi:hypothetical protein